MRRVVVEVPGEEKERRVGLLRKCMFGTADASARWQAHHAQILKEHGFVQDLSNPSLSVHVERDLRLLVHGDPLLGGETHS